MSAVTGARSRGLDETTKGQAERVDHGRRLHTETKASYKTTEFIAYVVILVGIFIAGAVTSGSVSSAGVHHSDAFPAHQVWLYATILTIGYMVSRGLAKAGSRQPYDEKS